MNGKYVIVRCDRAGVFAGTLKAHEETTVATFIELTKTAYNGSVIRNLEQAYADRSGV